ncbi:MAG: transcriptional repressor [Ktedonobacteraceae bacterium]
MLGDTNTMLKAILNENAQAVLDAVRSAHNHPTALDIYETVKLQRSRIGLASVYRILHNLVEQGYIRELRMGDENFSRYDGHTARHDHAICRSCGKLLDLPVEITLSHQALQDAAQAAGIKLETHEVRLYGLCVSCQEKQTYKAEEEV